MSDNHATEPDRPVPSGTAIEPVCGMSVAIEGANMSPSMRAPGLISVADPIRETSHTAISELHERDIKVVMLTGTATRLRRRSPTRSH